MTWKIVEGNAMIALPKLATESFDAVISDPPYSSGARSTAGRMKSGNQKYLRSDTKKQYPIYVEGEMRDQRSWVAWAIHTLTQCYRITKPGGIVAMFSDWRQLPSLTDAVQAAGWCWRGLVSWDKTESSRTQRGRFSQQCEYVVWGSKGHLPMDRETLLPGRRLPGIFRHRVDHREKKHVTGKPIALMYDLLQICMPGSHVLDPFCGSGSTGVAAIQHGLDFTGIELSPEYAAIARKSLRDAARGLRT